MNSPAITILSFGRFERVFLEKISEVVMHEFNSIVTIKEAYLDISGFFDPGRRQYNGDKLLKVVNTNRYPDDG